MSDLLAGTTVLALDSPPSAMSTASSSFDCTITTYGTSASAGTYADCAVTFVAPTTGRVRISMGARFINTTSGGTMVAPETRLGSTIGSGSIVEGASDQNGVSSYGTTFTRYGADHALTGLTAGQTYNCRLLHKVTAGTGSIAYRELIVSPLT